MLVKFIMTPYVECVSPGATLEEAAREMRDLDVGVMPVCSEGRRLIGMITDRDIAIRSTADGLDPQATRVADVMTDEVIYCFEDQDVKEAIQLMEEYRVRRLAVANRDKCLVGMVTLGDLAIRANRNDAAEVLREISEPSRAEF